MNSEYASLDIRERFVGHCVFDDKMLGELGSLVDYGSEPTEYSIAILSKLCEATVLSEKIVGSVLNWRL